MHNSSASYVLKKFLASVWAIVENSILLTLSVTQTAQFAFLRVRILGRKCESPKLLLAKHDIFMSVSSGVVGTEVGLVGM